MVRTGGPRTASPPFKFEGPLVLLYCSGFRSPFRALTTAIVFFCSMLSV